MISILRQREYGLLWTASFISRVGDFVLIAALPYFVYATSGSALAAGVVVVSETVPALLCSAIGGVYADRWRRQPVLVVGDVLRALVLLPLVAVHSTSSLWIVYATAFCASAVASFVSPFASAAVPHVVQEQDLPSANAAFSAGNWIAVLIGTPLGGFLLQTAGFRGVVLVDALTFLISGLLIGRLRVALEEHGPPSRMGQGAGAAVSRVWTDWITGLNFIRHERWVSMFFLVTTLASFGNSMALVILAPFVRQTLHGAPQVYAWMLTAQGIGGIAASLLIGRVKERIAPAPLLAVSILAFGLLELAIAVAASVPVTLTAALLGGASVLGFVVSLNTILQSRIPDSYRGRVFGAQLTISALLGLVGSLLAGFLGDAIGIQVTFGISALLFIAAGMVALTTLVPTLRREELFSHGYGSSVDTKL